jgi:hypothetical protein
MAKSAKSGGNELLVLKKWQLMLAILGSILVPTVTATGAYFKKFSQVDEKINKLEVDTVKSYVDKDSFKRLDDRTRRMENDLVEIKTIVKQKLR